MVTSQIPGYWFIALARRLTNDNSQRDSGKAAYALKRNGRYVGTWASEQGQKQTQRPNNEKATDSDYQPAHKSLMLRLILLAARAQLGVDPITPRRARTVSIGAQLGVVAPGLHWKLSDEVSRG